MTLRISISSVPCGRSVFGEAIVVYLELLYVKRRRIGVQGMRARPKPLKL
jgi:hypothetical protein